MKNKLPLIIAIVILLAGFTILLLNALTPPANPVSVPPDCGQLRIYVINVSQADAILIITPKNKTILIDAGSEMKPHSADAAIVFLKQHNISHLDAVIATHYHEDHIGGMPAAFNAFTIASVYDNGNCGNYSSNVQKSFQQYAALHQHVVVQHDMDLSIDSCIQAKLIAPYDRPEGCWNSAKTTANENENSVVLHITYGNTSFLLAGDCEQHCEQILAARSDIRSDFLKIDHHGSATSSTMPFLQAVDAKYFAVSTSMNRSVTDGYFHPRQAALENIYAAGGREGNFFRTDLNGDVAVVSDGSRIIVTPQAGTDECSLFSGYSSTDVSSYKSVIPECG
ncbi:MAG: MBL fold metallo-hydrolase [Candidatus Micrarchaeota archaeon]